MVEAAPFHISQVCDELLDVVVARAASRKVKFIYETWTPIPFLVGDKFRLRQVLINLADNAVKFCPDENGIVVVSVTSEPIDNGTIMVQIDVTDNGIGISEKKRDLIFQPFSQVRANPQGAIVQGPPLNCPGPTLEIHNSQPACRTTHKTMTRTDDARRCATLNKLCLHCRKR